MNRSSGAAGRSQAEIERDLAIDTLVDLRLLHAGPAASLFRAYQVPTQRTVAVKVLHDELSSDTGQRFDRERAITGQLSGHTGIVPLFDTGSTADGEPYLVMPFYRRGSLADLMGRYGPLSWREATFLLEPVAVSLAELHGRELVHRNLKPGNILLTDFLLPRVADFGMCLPVGQRSTDATLVEGPYGSAELTEPSEADPRADVFGLGATLSGLLAGQPPTPPGPANDRPPSLTHPPVDPTSTGELGPATPEPIVDLVARSMAADPDERPANAAAFVTELRRVVGQADRAAQTATAAGTGTPGVLAQAGADIDPAVSLDAQPAFDLRDGGPMATGGAVDDLSITNSAIPGPGAPHGVDVVTDRPGPLADTDDADHVRGGPEGPRLDLEHTDTYLLALVAAIVIGIVLMVAAAVLAFN